jgi:hypothetical protein
MNWIADRLRQREDSRENVTTQSAQTMHDSEAERLWTRLLNGFEGDVQEYRRLGGDANFQQVSGFQCRISNPVTNTAAVVTADLSAETLEYSYEAMGKDTAVPENGIFTLRKSSESLEIFSADQKLNLEEARRLILEPLLFPNRPGNLQATGT